MVELPLVSNETRQAIERAVAHLLATGQARVLTGDSPCLRQAESCLKQAKTAIAEAAARRRARAKAKLAAMGAPSAPSKRTGALK